MIAGWRTHRNEDEPQQQQNKKRYWMRETSSSSASAASWPSNNTTTTTIWIRRDRRLFLCWLRLHRPPHHHPPLYRFRCRIWYPLWCPSYEIEPWKICTSNNKHHPWNTAVVVLPYGVYYLINTMMLSWTDFIPYIYEYISTTTVDWSDRFCETFE